MKQDPGASPLQINITQRKANKESILKYWKLDSHFDTRFIHWFQHYQTPFSMNNIAAPGKLVFRAAENSLLSFGWVTPEFLDENW